MHFGGGQPFSCLWLFTDGRSGANYTRERNNRHFESEVFRRFIADPALRIDGLHVGKRTRTEVRLVYLADVADPDLVAEVARRVAGIEIDGILESGYREQLITDNRLTLFPLDQSTERSDKVAAAVLEGRVAILVDKSPFALIVPTTINELYQSPEDYYFGFYLGSLLRCSPRRRYWRCSLF
ncbi:MAG: spore germination protein [Patescibacteria group bacterium]